MFKTMNQFNAISPTKSSEAVNTLSTQLRMQLLQRIHAQVVQVFHAFNGCFRARNGGEGGNPGQQCRGAYLTRVGNRIAALFHGVNDQRNLVIFDHVHHMRPAFGDLVDA